MSPICSVEFPEVKDSPPTGVDTVKWAKYIIKGGSKVVLGDKETTLCSSFLPDLTVVIRDGDAELLVSAQDLTPYNLSNRDSQYSAHFRIPPATLLDLPERECITRAQQFAVGSLIYTIMVGRPPFADLDDSLVQQNFEKGIYPPGTMEFPLEVAIPVLGYWSQEFAQQITEQIGDQSQTSILGKLLAHVKAQPISSGIAITGFLVFGTASLINPALGVAGFSAMGPAAGSAAAAWQSSIGLVQTGSFFAWCQSAAMGGTAAGAIIGAQGVGASAAGLGILGGIRGGGTNEEAARRMVWSLFMEKVRKAGGGGGGTPSLKLANPAKASTWIGVDEM